eukprot:TRINITY_DN2087_c0_g2_i2.p1 TRINITY_DN2087_c0_g2~~TRINITY_DN2087_c0_g2_i2.p1  ORF type:complete len:477 (-),score=64.82 TRINITY_DN2087_c0_g2_i2:173-1603(-)
MSQNNLSYMRLLDSSGSDFDHSMFAEETLPNTTYVNTQHIICNDQMPFNSNIITDQTNAYFPNLNDAFISNKEQDDTFVNWDTKENVNLNMKKRKYETAFNPLQMQCGYPQQQIQHITQNQHQNQNQNQNLNHNQQNSQDISGLNIGMQPNVVPGWLAQSRLQTGRVSDIDSILPSTEQPGTKKQRMMFSLSFENLPDYVFDVSGIPIKSLLTFSDTQDEIEMYNLTKDLFFYVCPVNIGEAKFVEEPVQLDCDSQITFSFDLYRKLAPKKNFSLWIQVFSYSTQQKLCEAVTPSITLMHDGLREQHPLITADVCFFPQKVVIAHLKNCNSKATLSKRHKKGKLKEGTTWCRNPKNCASKGQCGCQAYPSRILKKGVRELKLLLERSEAPPQITQYAADLYNILAQTADKQTEKLPTYDSFLKERIKRWKLFMNLKDYMESGVASKDAIEKFRFIYGLLPNPEAQGQPESKLNLNC